MFYIMWLILKEVMSIEIESRISTSELRNPHQRNNWG